MEEPTLLTLDELQDAHRRARTDGEQLAAQADELDARAEDRFADAGAYLVPRRRWWRAPSELVPRLAEADRLVARIAALDRRLARPRRPGAAPARLDRLTSARAAVVRRGRDRAAARLRATLVAIARAAASAGADVPDVGPVLEQAAELQARARHLRFSQATRARRLTDLGREIERRERAERLMGFDSLHLVACFSRYGLPQIESAYELEPGEVAHLTSEASLAPLPPGTRYLATGTGVVPTLAHTGVPHWMGALRDRPAPAGEGGQDRGVLLLTSHRLAFAGAGQSAAIWLDAVVDMDVFRDAIAVHHMGAEKPLILRVPAPRHVAFYVNWALRRTAAQESAR